MYFKGNNSMQISPDAAVYLLCDAVRCGSRVGVARAEASGRWVAECSCVLLQFGCCWRVCIDQRLFPSPLWTRQRPTILLHCLLVSYQHTILGVIIDVGNLDVDVAVSIDVARPCRIIFANQNSRNIYRASNKLNVKSRVFNISTVLHWYGANMPSTDLPASYTQWIVISQWWYLSTYMYTVSAGSESSQH